MRRSCLALVVLAVAPAFADDAKIVGTWEHKADDGTRLVVTFAADGSGTMNDTKITYALSSSDKLTIDTDGGSTTYTFKLDGDTLVVSGGDLDHPTSFARKVAEKKKTGLGGQLQNGPKGDPKGETMPAASKSIRGSWKGTDGSVLEVEQDACVIGGHRFPCAIGADSLTLTAMNGSKVVWPYKLDGDTLEITVGSQKQTWKRLDAAPEKGAPAQKSPERAEKVRGLPGKWKAANGAVLDFRGDGTVVSNGQSMAYKATASTVTVSGVEYAYKIDGDELTLTLDGASQTLSRVVESADAADPKVETAKGGNVVGAWDSAQGTAIFRADGTAFYNGEDFNWSADKGTLKLTQGEKSLTLPFTVDKDRLILGSGPSVTLTRAGIAGVWVAEEATLDPGNYLSFTQYLTLYKDGTIGYAKAEGYATRRQISECLERFMSGGEKTAEKKSVGTWKQDGDGTLSIKFDWRQDTIRARYDLDKMIMRVETMGRLPGNENGPLDFKRR